MSFLESGRTEPSPIRLSWSTGAGICCGIMGEPIGFNLGVGVIAVLAGIWIAAREPTPGRTDMNERLGVLIAVISSTSGGTAAAVTRYVVEAADPVTLAAFRFGIGVLVLLPLALLAAQRAAARTRLDRGRPARRTSRCSTSAHVAALRRSSCGCWRSA